MTFKFESSRLNIYKANKKESPKELDKLLNQILKILSSKVVQNLPPYFHDLNTKADALNWFNKMRNESHLFIIKEKSTNTIIGFLFAYEENKEDIHIGYLLCEEYWGKGFASELLKAFISFCLEQKEWKSLIGGVHKTNLASIHLLKKLGFKLNSKNNEESQFYKYSLIKN